MPNRLLFAASAVARFVFVVVAFGLAVGSIGVASARGFCPEATESAAALAAPAGGSPGGGAPALATIVEEPPDGIDPSSPAPAEDGPADGTAPADDTSPEEDADACPGGLQRCLPPLWSSVLILGEPACHDQAPARLRSILVPSAVGATILLAGAWWLRPSRLPAGRRQDSPAGR